VSDHTVNSAWTLELSPTGIKRLRNFKAADGVPALPLEKKLRDLFMGLAGLAEMVGDEFSSKVVENKAEELAYGWARVAQENEKVRIAIKWMVETTAWTDAVVPTVLVGGSIAWRYGMVPDQIGQPIAKFAGAIPMTPEEEEALAAQAAQMQKMMESEEATVHENVPPTDDPPVSETEPDSPRVVPIPPDADLEPDS
jgi:hypothetical protein